MASEKTLKALDAETLQEWRQWLTEHHDPEREVWVVFYKQHTCREWLTYAEALDEALCFGWVDILIRRIDDARCARKFTPRKPGSKWSTSNRQRYAELKACGRMAPAGLNRPPTDPSGDTPRLSLTKIPAYIEETMKSRAAVWKFFQALAPSCRREYIAWIDSAKREATRQRRLKEAMTCLADGRKLGMK